MKRKALVLTAVAAAIAIGAATLVPAYAHGPGYGRGGGWGGGPGYGMHMGPGMMGGGMGMMGPGTMGPGMMGPGMMGPGQGFGPGNCPFATASTGQEVTVDTVTKFVEARLAHWGNDRLKLGKVEATDDAITGEIVTKDGSLVHKFAFDKATGRPLPAK